MDLGSIVFILALVTLVTVAALFTVSYIRTRKKVRDVRSDSEAERPGDTVRSALKGPRA